MKRTMAMAFLGLSGALAIWACGGSTTSASSADGGPDGSSGSSGGSSSSGSGSGSSSGGFDSGNASSSGSGGSSGGGSSGSSSGSLDDAGDGSTVPGNTFPCGTNVCNAPDVCCAGMGNPTCEARSQCMGVAVGCTATTCPTGSVCCGELGTTGGYTECVVGGCDLGQHQLCSTGTPMVACPPGQDCLTLGGPGGAQVCVTPPDGGFHFDGGYYDAGHVRD